MGKKRQRIVSFEEKEAEAVVADEQALLNSIANLKFKPFDDSQNFEVLNDFDDFYATEDYDPNNVLTFEEIASEFEELYSEKITNNKTESKKQTKNSKAKGKKEFIRGEKVYRNSLSNTKNKKK